MKTIYFPPDAKREGIDITWTKHSNILSISGWYDTFVGIEPTQVHLGEFLTQLGITEKDCKKAFAQIAKEKRERRVT